MTHSFRVIALILVLSHALATNSEKDHNNSLSGQESSHGWELLFDGESFNGWQGTKGHPVSMRSWAVEDGMICTQNDRSGGDIVSVDRFTDFVLELEWKITPGGNSGIKYLVQQEWLNPGFDPTYEEERKQRMWRSAVGFEYQVLDDTRLKPRPGWEKSSTGALYLLYSPQNKKLNPPGEWNQSRIEVRGTHVEHWLNGSKLLELELDSPQLFERIESTKFRRVPGYGIKSAGHLSLQHHGSPACFRNLKLRSLTN